MNNNNINNKGYHIKLCMNWFYSDAETSPSQNKSSRQTRITKSKFEICSGNSHRTHGLTSSCQSDIYTPESSTCILLSRDNFGITKYNPSRVWDIYLSNLSLNKFLPLSLTRKCTE